MISLIDGDVILYSCGFASDAGARANGWEKEPLPFCLHGVDKMIDAVLRDSKSDENVIFLSSPVSNFRDEMYPDYKLNRDPTHKPVWYEEIREHLFNKHNAIFADIGDEADDALGIAQCSGDYGGTVICTIDKDLDMIPGLHYNWSKKRRHEGVYEVSEEEGNRVFYKQLITGDPTDNIPGLFKYCGKKATKRILAPLDELNTPEEMFGYVLSVYDGDYEWINMIAPLLWIKRDEEGRWQP